MKQELAIYDAEAAKAAETDACDAYLERLTELHQLRRRADDLWRGRRAAEAEAVAVRAACRRELRGLAAFVGVGACAVAATVCLVAAPWWTATAPMLLALAVLRRVRW